MVPQCLDSASQYCFWGGLNQPTLYCLYQSECWELWILNTHVPPSRREYPLHVKQGRVVEVYAF
jgi:hypothetical protein